MDHSGDSKQAIEPVPKKRLGRIGYEFAFEFVLVVLGFALAFGLTTKVIVAIVVTCLKFAIPDFITGWLVLRRDPDRWHGRALALLFVSMGFVRASVSGFVVLIAGLFVLLMLGGPAAGGDALTAGFGVGFICAYGFLSVVFPITFLAFVIAWVTGKKLDFAAGLTKLRRSKNATAKEIDLSVWKGLKGVGIASAFSLSISLIVPLVWISNLAFLVAAFVLPVTWMLIFWSVTAEREQST